MGLTPWHFFCMLLAAHYNWTALFPVLKGYVFEIPPRCMHKTLISAGRGGDCI